MTKKSWKRWKADQDVLEEWEGCEGWQGGELDLKVVQLRR